MTAAVPETKVAGYLPQDTPPIGSMISLGFQQVLTMFPATVLVAILTKFDVGVTLLASGLGTIIALLVSKRRIPMYYGSSFSYISVVITAMNLYAKDCFADAAMTYCADGVRIVQVGILGTAVVEILVGLLIMRVGKAALDRRLVQDHGILHVIPCIAEVAIQRTGVNMTGNRPSAVIIINKQSPPILKSRVLLTSVREHRHDRIGPTRELVHTVLLVPAQQSIAKAREWSCSKKAGQVASMPGLLARAGNPAYLCVLTKGVWGVCSLYSLLSVRCCSAWTGVPIVCLAIWHWYMLRGDWLKSE